MHDNSSQFKFVFQICMHLNLLAYTASVLVEYVALSTKLGLAV